MLLTAEQANELLDSVHTKEQLFDLIDRVDHRVDGVITVLYSGYTGDSRPEGSRKLHSGAIAEALIKSGNHVRTIDQSEAGKFLNQAEGTQFYNEKLRRKLEEIFRDNPDELRSFMDGERIANTRINNGVWDRLSAKYAADAVGEVVTLTGGAVGNRVFFQTELPIILGNPNVTSIDGIPIEAFRGLTTEEAFSIIIAASDERASKLMIAVDAAGNPMMVDRHYVVDARSFFADSNVISGNSPPPDTPMRSMADFIPQERVAAHREALREIRMAQDNLAVHYKQDLQTQGLQSPSRWLRAMDQLGHIADVVSLAAVAHEAKAAMDAGDPDAAQRIMTQWALENAGAILAGRLASLVAAPLLAAGPLGWLAAGGLVLSASMLGSAYADEVAGLFAGRLADLWDQALEALRHQFQAAEQNFSCPLVLDLDGNGVITSAEDRSAIHFDHDNNGFAERTGWISPTDGLLVHDLDGNGLIDHGGELFGNNTLLSTGVKATNGFEALKVLDGNGDQWIDHHDSAWSTLKVWIDGNSNAVADHGELLSLGDAGVRRLGVAFSTSDFVDLHGNRHLQIGDYQASDGTFESMHDVWFRVDQARTRWRHPIALDPGTEVLPDLKGMGNVRDLHQAMASDSSGQLRLILERWIQGGDVQREALIDPLIFFWIAGSLDENSQNITSIDRRLVVMQHLLGQTFRQGMLDPRPFGMSVPMLHRAYEDFRFQLEGQLILQTDALPILQHFFEPDGAFRSDPSFTALQHVANYLDGYMVHRSDVLKLFRLGRALRSLGDEGELVVARIQESLSSRIDSDQPIYRLLSEHHYLQVSASSSHLFGSDGQDLLVGGSGNDVLSGGSGHDWLIAGSGNDTLNGGVGDDVYVIAKGGDRKRISDLDHASANRDLVMFTTMAPGDVSLVERLGLHLYLHYGSGDQLLVDNYFASEVFRIEGFQFGDGTLWGDAQLRERAVVGGATAGNDWLGGFSDMVNRVDALDGDDQVHGGGFNDVLKGGNGHDGINGHDGDDSLDGGSGNDVLSGGSGRDWLVAGSGNDTLNGGVGDDVYVIAKAGDRKQISDLDHASANRDLVMFTTMAPGDVSLVERLGLHLYLHYRSGDQLLVDNYFASEVFRIEGFQFGDGTLWGDAQLRERAVVGGATAGNDWLGGFSDMVNRVDALDGDDQVHGGGFNDVLKGGNGHDGINGHDGDDSLDGGSGNDLLSGGSGRDWLVAGSGNDTLNGGVGDDVYVIAKGGDRKQISDLDHASTNRDLVLFQDLRSQDVSAVERHGNQLLMRQAGGGLLEVENYFLSESFRVESFQFSNGTVWGDSQLKGRVVVGGATSGNDTLGGFNDMVNRIKGLDGNDSLSGGVLNDVLTGGNGHDTLHGGDGDDILDGGSGQDVLFGGRGRDRLISGSGSDTLNGGEGDDSYVIVRGGSRKHVSDFDANLSSRDTVVFSNLKSTELSSVRRIEHHLEIGFVSNDQLLASNFFLGMEHRIEAFQFSNGVTMGVADLLALVPPA